MPNTFNYPVEIERDEDGRVVVTFPDCGWEATDGATLNEALDEAKDLLRELIAATIFLSLAYLSVGRARPTGSRITSGMTGAS